MTVLHELVFSFENYVICTTLLKHYDIPANNDPWRDFTCSVSEFTSSTGSIHVFPCVDSPDSVNKFSVSTCVYSEITSFSCDDMYQ